MIRIACLHTARTNIAVFDSAMVSAGLKDVVLAHAVREDLLAAAEREQCLTAETMRETVEALTQLCVGADAVLLTCSTLGKAAELAATDATVPVLRVDAALAAEAVKDGGRVVVLCAVETTMEPTRDLFETFASATGAEVTVRLAPGAWAAFKAGLQGRYLDMIAEAARQAQIEGATTVALAQASMAGACALFPREERPLSSPAAGLLAAVRAVKAD